MSRMKRMAERVPAWHRHLQGEDFRADGATFDPEQDGARLGKQAGHVWRLLNMEGPDGQLRWWTVQLMQQTGVEGSETGISARIRDFRKDKFGGHTVERRRRKDGKGTWEYRLRVNGDE